MSGSSSGPKKIIHLDMDAFYASVEELYNPELRGRPVIVGGDSDRGVVCAASYAARKFGVHSAMSIVAARRCCPHGVFLRPNMARYQEISGRIMTLFHSFTPLVEPLSLDEAFLDVTASEKLFGEAAEIAAALRRQVLEETGLTVSAGVASSKLVAKIASDMQKPDGLTVVAPGQEKAFLAPLSIEKLWGVGKATRNELAMIGVQTIGDLAHIPLEILSRRFGKHGRHLHCASQAIDSRPVEPIRDTKSIGNEETFARDLIKICEIERELLALAVKVGKRLRKSGCKARTVVIKTKYCDFVQTTKSKTVSDPTNDSAVLYKVGCQLLGETLAGSKPLRLLGLTCGNLIDCALPQQAGLFDTATGSESRKKLQEAVDAITDKFGAQILQPGALTGRGRSGGGDEIP